VILGADPADHLYWLGSRAAGTAALVLVSVTVLVGALRAGGLAGSEVRGGTRRLELAIVHEALGIAAMVLIFLHGVVLLGDDFLKPSVADVAIPFVSNYERVPNGIGIVSGYLFIVLGLTYYVRDRMGETFWMVLHRFTLLAWIGSFIHTLGMGTDRKDAWFLIVIFLPAVAALVALAMRLFSNRGAPAPAQPSA
jgi:methionine sulfoxide reductase heme-binding subunit